MARDADNESQKKLVHFFLVPFMAQGHMIPTIDLARLLAERGMPVSIITTPVNITRNQPTVDRIKASGLQIDFVPLRFPATDVGLPDGFERIDLLGSLPDVLRFFRATAMLEEPVKVYIKEYLQKNRGIKGCLISDFSHPWTRHVSKELKIPRFVFYSVCCFTIYLGAILPRVSADHVGEGAMLVPDLPHRVEVARPRDPVYYVIPMLESMRSEVVDSDSDADGVIVNSFSDMEPIYVERYSEETGKKVWPVGPVSLCNREAADKAERGDKSSTDADRILCFLDSMKQKTVVYVNLGTIVQPSLAQLKEIGYGLESTGHPFIWNIMAHNDKMPEIEEWLKNDGVEERTRTRSLILRGWAPQMTILSHPSTAAFVTHCGWNSSLESIAAGIPTVGWPCLSDQFLNCNFLVDVVRTGVPMGPTKVISQGDELSTTREDIVAAVDRVMDGGEEGEERRKRATRLAEMAARAMEVGGSSHTALTDFINQLVEHPLFFSRREETYISEDEVGKSFSISEDLSISLFVSI